MGDGIVGYGHSLLHQCDESVRVIHCHGLRGRHHLVVELRHLIRQVIAQIRFELDHSCSVRRVDEMGTARSSVQAVGLITVELTKGAVLALLESMASDLKRVLTQILRGRTFGKGNGRFRGLLDLGDTDRRRPRACKAALFFRLDSVDF